MADLVTTNEYKDAEGIRGEKEDDRLNVIVPQVSDLVKKYCGTSFVDYYSTNKVETFSISDNYTSTIIVSESPLTAVDVVQERTSYSGDYSTLTTGNYEYYVDLESDAIIRTDDNGNHKMWARGVGSVKITCLLYTSPSPRD